ncbi:MAG TPA: hypothetical protein VML50_14785 [Anaeromyxobacter sp.]|nr:hypothetical protein [Anaeromyxobacter sp.]
MTCRGARTRLLAVPVALALACAGARPRSDAPVGPTRQAIAVPGEGSLELVVPRGWQVKRAPGEEGEARTVELSPSGRAYVVLVTPLAPSESPGATDDAAQGLVELARRKALAGSVEREIPLMELRGPAVHGYWFEATDRSMEGRSPAPEEFRHVLQGAVAVGPLLVAFTLLDNGPGPHREVALDLVRTARFRPEGGAPGEEVGDGFEPDPDVETVPLAITSPDGALTALVDLPGFRMFRPRPGPDGTSVLVLGEDPETGIVASLLLRQTPGADAQACREDALTRIRRSAPDLAELRLSEPGGSVRLGYVLTELRGRAIRQRHDHAFLVHGGTCVNLHLSKADPGPDDDPRFERILTSLRLGERL